MAVRDKGQRYLYPDRVDQHVACGRARTLYSKPAGLFVPSTFVDKTIKCLKIKYPTH